MPVSTGWDELNAVPKWDHYIKTRCSQMIEHWLNNWLVFFLNSILRTFINIWEVLWSWSWGIMVEPQQATALTGCKQLSGAGPVLVLICFVYIYYISILSSVFSSLCGISNSFMRLHYSTHIVHCIIIYSYFNFALLVDCKHHAYILVCCIIVIIIIYTYMHDCWLIMRPQQSIHGNAAIKSE